MAVDIQTKKKFIYLIAGLSVSIIVIAIGLITYSTLQQSTETKAPPSKVTTSYSSNRLTDQTYDKSYELLLADYNKIGAQQAQHSGESFVGKPTAAPRVVEVNSDQRRQEWEAEVSKPATVPNYSTPPKESKLDAEKQKRLFALLNKIEDKRTRHAAEQVMVAATAYKTEKTDTNNNAQWVASLYPDINTAALGNSNIAPQPGAAIPNRGMQLIAGLATFPAIVDTAVNSDNRSMKMVAHIVSGKLKGAQLYSNELALAGEGIEAKFSRMQWNGIFYPIEAYAVETATNEFAIASEVNNRWFSRIILPAIAHGIGQTGQLYRDSNSKVIIGDSGTEYREQKSPNGTAVAGTIIGGIGEQAGKVLAEEASKLPAKQVKVDVNKVIGIQFINPVYAGDQQK